MTALLRKMLATALLALGVLATLGGLAVLTEATSTRYWETTTGTVITSRVKHLGQSRYGPDDVAEIVYRYRVGPSAFLSDEIGSRGTGYGGHAAAVAAVTRYPIGRTVAVHYDPRHPDKAVLETGGNGYTAIPLGFGLAFSALGLCGLLWGVRRAR